MNVLLLTNHFNTGGITSYVLNVSRGLLRNGHRVFVAGGTGNCVDYLKYYGARHVPIDIHVKSEVHPKVFNAVHPLSELVKEEHIDIIHANTRVTQVLSAFLSRQTKRPFVSTAHGFFKP